MKQNNDHLTEDLPGAAREILSKKQWAEALLGMVHNIKKSHGSHRLKELAILEMEILMQAGSKISQALINAKAKEAALGFCKKMKRRFPALSENEIMFCGYIRLNFDSESIAVLKGIKVSSVNMARYRLRRKLGLDKEKPLDEFVRDY